MKNRRLVAHYLKECSPSLSLSKCSDRKWREKYRIIWSGYWSLWRRVKIHHPYFSKRMLWTSVFWLQDLRKTNEEGALLGEEINTWDTAGLWSVQSAKVCCSHRNSRYGEQGGGTEGKEVNPRQQASRFSKSIHIEGIYKS